MTHLGLLAKQKTRTGYAVIERKSLDSQPRIFIYHPPFARIDDVIDYLKRALAVEKIHPRFQQCSTFAKHVYRHLTLHTVERHGRQQPRQPEHMVAMKMRDKNVAQTRKLQPHTPERRLCTLTTIYHKQFVAEVHHLTRRLMARRRCSRPAAQYIDLKLCHNTKVQQNSQIQKGDTKEKRHPAPPGEECRTFQ